MKTTDTRFRELFPKEKDRYRLYLSIARPDSLFITDLQEKFQTAGIEVKNSNLGQLSETTWFHYPSDYLGDIVHSLNVRSDNLYAESILRLLSLSAHEKGSVEKGIDIIRKYWQNYEADSLELFMYDGSGLARNNKVSAKYLNWRPQRNSPRLTDWRIFRANASFGGKKKALSPHL